MLAGQKSFDKSGNWLPDETPDAFRELRVEISATKVTGKQKLYETADSPAVGVVRELLPARYDVKSEHTLTIEAGHREERFDLKSN